MQESITRGSWLQSSDGKTYFKGTVNRYSGARAMVEKGLHYRPRATITKYHKLAGWNSQNVLFHSLGASSPKSRATLPLKSGGKALFQASLLASANYLLCSITPVFTGCSPCVCLSPNVLSLGRYQSFWLRGPFYFSMTSLLTHDIWHIS